MKHLKYSKCKFNFSCHWGFVSCLSFSSFFVLMEWGLSLPHKLVAFFNPVWWRSGLKLKWILGRLCMFIWGGCIFQLHYRTWFQMSWKFCLCGSANAGKYWKKIQVCALHCQSLKLNTEFLCLVGHCPRTAAIRPPGLIW